jgi:hypothetical protein
MIGAGSASQRTGQVRSPSRPILWAGTPRMASKRSTISAPPSPKASRLSADQIEIAQSRAGGQEQSTLPDEDVRSSKGLRWAARGEIDEGPVRSHRIADYRPVPGCVGGTLNKHHRENRRSILGRSRGRIGYSFALKAGCLVCEHALEGSSGIRKKYLQCRTPLVLPQRT